MAKKIIFYYLIFTLVLGGIMVFKPNLVGIRTDSGWDSSYDSGSSSSDWSSSSSSGDWSSSDYSSSGSGGGGEFTFAHALVFEIFLSIFYFVIILLFIGENKKGMFISAILTLIRGAVMVFLELTISPFLFLISFFGVFPLALIGGSKQNNNNNRLVNNLNNSSKMYQELSQDKLLSYGIDDVALLKKNLYQIFVDVQNAWMEFDYDKLSQLCGDELYNSYKSDLETLKLKNGKNIMDSFKLWELKVYNITTSKDEMILDVYLRVQFHDYVINTTNNNVIRGNKTQIHNNEYLLKYKKKNVVLDKCPACGAKIDDKSNQVCSYCGTNIVNNNSNYILVEKGRI